MNAEMETIGRCLLGPAVVAGVVSLILLRALPVAGARQFAAAVGCGVGFVAGYAWLEPANWKPVSHWHWLPWIGMLAMIVGPVAALPRVPSFARWGLWLIAALVAAWFLVPNWEKLRPVREVYVAGFAATVFFLTLIQDLLARRTSPAILVFGWGMSAAVGAAILAAFLSLRFGMLAGAAGAGFAGVGIVHLRHGDRESVRGAVLGYAVAVGGLMLAGLLTDVLPTGCFVLILCAPLALWACEIPVLARIQGRWATVLRLAAVSAPLLAAGLIAGLSAQSPAGW